MLDTTVVDAVVVPFVVLFVVSETTVVVTIVADAGP